MPAARAELMAIACVALAHGWVNAGDRNATWTVTPSDGGARCTRKGDLFTNCRTGESQRITVRGQGCEIASGKVRNLSFYVHWKGTLTRFQNTVLARDIPGIHKARFFGTWRRVGPGEAYFVGTWEFEDTVEVRTDCEWSDTAHEPPDAKVTVNYPKHYAYYEVRGATLRDVARAMTAYARQNFPSTKEYGHCAYTTVQLVDRTRKSDHLKDQECPVCGRKHVYRYRYYYTEFTVEGSATIHLPMWREYEDASEQDKKTKPHFREWKRFYDALKKHEDGHYGIALEYARRVGRRFGDLKGRGWAEEWLRARELANRAFVSARDKEIWPEETDRLDKEQEDYDQRTGNGSKQSAVLDVTK